jgi:hypothetical protein
MALGAPAELLQQTQRALGDEIEHAKLCFGLASAYAERELGPGALAIEGALSNRSSAQILETALLEACVGETLAAVEAAAALEHATDPQVRAVLERIASDEARHAELGWAFMSWALERVAPRLAHELVETLYRTLEATANDATAQLLLAETENCERLAHGLLSPRKRAEARRAGLEEILLPCAEALRARVLAQAA